MRYMTDDEKWYAVRNVDEDQMPKEYFIREEGE
jgi:hypothetical protein